MSWDDYVLLPVGVVVYYVAHYDRGDREQDATLRGLPRTFAIVVLATSVAPHPDPPADGIATTETVFSVVFVATLTAVLAVLDAAGEDDGGDGDRGTDEEGASTPRWRRPAWRDRE